DALKFEDPDDPRAGLLFDGRVAEDFKLATGTWVNVGPLRARLLQALEPYARDVVIAGADRNEIGALIFPSVEACRKLAAGADVARDARLREELRARLTAFASTSTGSSNPACRLQRPIGAGLADGPRHQGRARGVRALGRRAAGRRRRHHRLDGASKLRHILPAAAYRSLFGGADRSAGAHGAAGLRHRPRGADAGRGCRHAQADRAHALRRRRVHEPQPGRLL